MRWNWWRARGWRKQAHKCWLYPSHLFSCAFQPCPLWYFIPSTPLFLSPSFCCFFQSLTRLSPHAFSPPPPPPHTFSHFSLPLHLLCRSSPLLFPPLLPTPTHSWYSTDLSGQLYDISAEKGLSWHWRQHFTGSSACSTLLQYACVFHRTCEEKWWTGPSTSPVGERADWNGYQLENSAERGEGHKQPTEMEKQTTY